MYEILTKDGSFILANSLSEAAKIVGLYPDTLSKYLDFEKNECQAGDRSRKDGYVEIKNHFIKRVRVFTGPASQLASPQVQKK